MSNDPVDRGLNTRTVTRDDGLATDYTLTGPVAGVRDSAGVSGFCAAIRTQGNESVRHKAISMMMERACSTASLPAKAFRILHRLAHNCRGPYRYSCEPHDTLAFYSGLASSQNFNRYLRVLLELNFIDRFALRRPAGGHPIPIYTVVCSPEDRTGTARRRLRELALERRANSIRSREGAALLSEIEQDDLLRTLKGENALSKPPNDDLQLLTQRTCAANTTNLTSEDRIKSSDRGDANPHDDDHNVDKVNVEFRLNIIAHLESGYGGEAYRRIQKRGRRLMATPRQFDRFWHAYPRKKGKRAALFLFIRLSREQAEHAACAAERYAKEIKARPSMMQNVRWPEHWLRTRKFDPFEV